VDRLRDRLLGELLPDPDAALASLAAAERAMDNVRSAQGELGHHATQLLQARRDLARHGLTEEQIDQLLRLTPAEVTRG
jgi:ABC-type transport system involved in cytochrome bd biosynthesis fused ATPase/permease subunit